MFFDGAGFAFQRHPERVALKAFVLEVVDALHGYILRYKPTNSHGRRGFRKILVRMCFVGRTSRLAAYTSIVPEK